MEETPAKEPPAKEPAAKEPSAEEPPAEDTSTGGRPASGDGPAGGTRYPVLSRLPEAPGRLADMIARLPVAEIPETGWFFRKREEEGTLEFYPWRFGPGYLFADQGRQRRLRRSFRRFWAVAGLLLFALEIALQEAFSLGADFFETGRFSGVLGFFAETVGELALAGGLGIFALGAYSALAYSWVSGRPEAGRRGFFEELRRGAEMKSATDLWCVELLSLGVALLGGAVAWKGAALVGTFCAGLFGALALMAGYQLWWRWGGSGRRR